MNTNVLSSSFINSDVSLDGLYDLDISVPTLLKLIDEHDEIKLNNKSVINNNF